MEHPFITLFEPVLAIGTKEDAVSYLLQHPVLTSSYYTGLLQHWAETLAPADRQRAEWAIALKLDLFQQMKARKIRIEPPLPVLDLAGNVAKGVFTLQYAEQAASRPELFVELMYPSITLTCEVAEQGMLRDWRPAVTIMRILFAALDARRKVIPENQDAMERLPSHPGSSLLK